MAPYNRRDIIGHWVTKRARTQQMCQHACCRGRRVHPENYPVILPNPLLKRASDDDLAKHYRKVSAGSSPEDEAASWQVLAEMDRRDQREIDKHNRALEAKRRLFGKQMAHAEEVERVYVDADRATKGNMLNKAGRSAGISDRSLFTGPESRVRRYGSEELRNYFADNGRPTWAYMQGKDTKLGAQYSAPRRKQYGVTTRTRKGYAKAS
jgi:hypothetical protein